MCREPLVKGVLIQCRSKLAKGGWDHIDEWEQMTPKERSDKADYYLLLKKSIPPELRMKLAEDGYWAKKADPTGSALLEQNPPNTANAEYLKGNDEQIRNVVEAVANLHH